MTQPSWVGGRVADVADRASAWLADPALARLAARLGGPEPRNLDALTHWTAETLDTRSGAERHDAVPVRWDRGRIDALLDAAGPLGLLATCAPSRIMYDATVVLGGTATGNRLRVDLARRLHRGGVNIGELVLLSAARPLAAAERDGSADVYEWENLLRNATTAFGAGDLRAGSRPAEPVHDETLHADGGLLVRLLVASPGEGRLRASTSDAAHWLLTRLPPGGRSSVLLITSAIYAPYQFFAVAPLLLGAGTNNVELVGTPTAATAADGQSAQRIAQEIHAGVESAARIVTASRDAS